MWAWMLELSHWVNSSPLFMLHLSLSVHRVHQLELMSAKIDFCNGVKINRNFQLLFSS